MLGRLFGDVPIKIDLAIHGLDALQLCEHHFRKEEGEGYFLVFVSGRLSFMSGIEYTVALRSLEQQLSRKPTFVVGITSGVCV